MNNLIEKGNKYLTIVNNCHNALDCIIGKVDFITVHQPETDNEVCHATELERVLMALLKRLEVMDKSIIL